MSADEEYAGREDRLTEWQEDYPALFAKLVATDRVIVENTGGDAPTAYIVDLEDLSCNCQHGQRGGPDGRICKHVSKAIETIPEWDAVDLQVRDLSVLVDRAAEAVRQIEETRDVERAVSRAAIAQPPGEGDPDRSDAEAVDFDPVDALYAKLEAIGVPEADEKFEAWIDDQFNSLQFKANGFLSDGEYERYMDWVTSDDYVNWDRDNERNFIKSDEIEEALA